MREGKTQLTCSGATGYTLGKNILDLNLKPHTKIHSNGSQIQTSFKEQNFRNNGRDTEKRET